MAYSLDIVVIVLSIVAAAFFAGAETALTAASRARMHALEMAGDNRAKLVTRLIGMRGRLISAMLLGGQFVTIGASAIATSVLLGLFGDRGVLAATVIMTALIVVFGEVLPKTIAIAYPDLFAVFAGTARTQTSQPIEIIVITMVVYLGISLATSLLMNWYNARVRLTDR